MIRLFNSGATTFDTNGLGSLRDAISCVVRHEVNGEYELELSYPVSGRHYDDIQHRRIIYTEPDAYSTPQPFRIYHISRPINGVISVNARHICYDLSGYPVGLFRSESLSDTFTKIQMNYVLAYYRIDDEEQPSDWESNPERYFSMKNLGTTWGRTYSPVESGTEWVSKKFYKKLKEIPFTLSTTLNDYILVETDPGDMTTKFKDYYTRRYDPDTHDYVYEQLASAPQQFIENTYYRKPYIESTKPQTVKSIMGDGDGMMLSVFPGEWDYNGWTATLRDRLGQDRGIYISYGKNLMDLKVDEDSSEMAEAIYPYYYNKSNGIVELDEKILATGEWDPSGPDNYTSVLPVDLTKMFDKPPTKGQLKNMALAWISNNNPGNVSIADDISIVSLRNSSDYCHLKNLEDIRLGDTIHLHHSFFKIDRTARCNSIEYDAISGRYIKIGIGKDNRDLSKTISAAEVSSFNKDSLLSMIAPAFGSHIRMTTDEDGKISGFEITEKRNDQEDVDQGWSISIGKDGISHKARELTIERNTDTGEEKVIRVRTTKKDLLRATIE